ncbi:unnamed protein product [Cyprideis torosa]|uniref:Uncharacterized protein n=1 Tax=Cyprideis torosa TaxID=163714 RepID=A0A7R8ZKD8_9CRUS|nr:unnamed protein product [Cyprideis torosa]CAG0890695.1 unnamed protein product [Cyprideis torosa]
MPGYFPEIAPSDSSSSEDDAESLVRYKGNTALHEAAWRGFSQTVESLSASGANLRVENTSGFAPIHLAAQQGHNQSLRILLVAGCVPDLRNTYGDTALHTACRYGHAGVARILISAKCFVDAQNKNGDTPLHIAAAMGKRKLTRILLESGAKTSIRNQSPPPPSRTTRRSNRSVGEAPPERTRSEERPTDAEDEAEPLSSARSGMSRARSAHHLNSISSTSARQPGTLSTSSTGILSSNHLTRTGSDGPTSARSQSSRVSSPHYLPMAPSKGSSAWGPVRRAVGKASGARESTSGGSRSGGSMLRGYSGSNRELNLLTSYLSQMRSNVRELRQQFEQTIFENSEEGRIRLSKDLPQYVYGDGCDEHNDSGYMTRYGGASPARHSPSDSGSPDPRDQDSNYHSSEEPNVPGNPSPPAPSTGLTPPPPRPKNPSGDNGNLRLTKDFLKPHQSLPQDLTAPSRPCAVSTERGGSPFPSSRGDLSLRAPLSGPPQSSTHSSLV